MTQQERPPARQRCPECRAPGVRTPRKGAAHSLRQAITWDHSALRAGRQPALAHEPAPPATRVNPDALIKALGQGVKLTHNPWTRFLWVETGSGAQLFAAGSVFSCTVACAQTLCDPDRLGQLDQGLSEPELDLLCELLNRGHLYLEPL